MLIMSFPKNFCKLGPVLLAFPVLVLCACLSCAQSSPKQPAKAKVSGPTIIPPPGVTIGEVGRGPLEGYTTGFDYVERAGKTVEVPRIAMATPLKPEYAKWLLVEVTLSVDGADSGEWRLRAKDVQLRASRMPSESSYECLGIVSPSVGRAGESWMELSVLQGAKALLRGGQDFAETRWSGVHIVSTIYEEIGLPNAKSGNLVKAYLAFPPNTPGSGELVLGLTKR